MQSGSKLQHRAISGSDDLHFTDYRSSAPLNVRMPYAISQWRDIKHSIQQFRLRFCVTHDHTFDAQLFVTAWEKEDYDAKCWKTTGTAALQGLTLQASDRA
jgi:hypothetical protein